MAAIFVSIGVFHSLRIGLIEYFSIYLRVILFLKQVLNFSFVKVMPLSFEKNQILHPKKYYDL